MMSILKSLLLAAAAHTLALPALAQGRDPAQQAVPAWVQREIPGAGHAALAPLVGSWRVELSIYGTMGRSPDLPPIVSHDIRTTRVWIADGQYIEDTMRRQRTCRRIGSGDNVPGERAAASIKRLSASKSAYRPPLRI